MVSSLQCGLSSHRVDGGRESDVGSPADSRRVAHVWLRGIGGNGFAMDATNAEMAASRPALANCMRHEKLPRDGEPSVSNVFRPLCLPKNREDD
jgi:IS5 family transposase